MDLGTSEGGHQPQSGGPPAGGRRFRWRYPIYLVCLAVILVWASETPSGILGKMDAVGFAVCHRITSRSFLIGDRPMPLCARCSGMYLGAVGAILTQLLARRRRGGLPGWKTGIPFLFFALAFAADGLNSYLHLFPGLPTAYEPRNWLRLLTGTGMGIAMAAVLVPAFHQTVWRRWDGRQVYQSWKDYALVLLPAFSLSALVLIEDSALRYVLAILSALGVILVLGMVYSILWIMLLRRDNRAENTVDLLPALAAGVATAVLQVGLMDWVRFALTGSWSGWKL